MIDRLWLWSGQPECLMVCVCVCMCVWYSSLTPCLPPFSSAESRQSSFQVQLHRWRGGEDRPGCRSYWTLPQVRETARTNKIHNKLTVCACLQSSTVVYFFDRQKHVPVSFSFCSEWYFLSVRWPSPAALGLSCQRTDSSSLTPTWSPTSTE